MRHARGGESRAGASIVGGAARVAPDWMQQEWPPLLWWLVPSDLSGLPPTDPNCTLELSLGLGRMARAESPESRETAVYCTLYFCAV